MTRHGLVRRTAATAVLVATMPVTSGRAVIPAAPPVQPCTEFAASPAFSKDHTAFCAGRTRDSATGHTTGFVVFRTSDGGRTWTSAAAAGLFFNNADADVRYLGVSPLFATDRALFLQVGNTGLFESTDAGTSFSLVDPLAWGSLTSHVVTAPAGLLPVSAPARAAFLMALGGDADGEPNKSALIDPFSHAHTLVSGTPGRDLAFAVSDTYERDGAAFAVATSGVGLDAQVEVYRCEVTFTCAQRLFGFPKRWTFDRIWLSRDFAKSKTIYVSTTPISGSRTLWWSRDAGRTWARWTAAERLLAPIVKAHGSPSFGLAAGPAGSRTLFFRVSHLTGPGDEDGPPAEQLFRSSDNGVTWVQIAYGRAPGQRGPRGTAPGDNPLFDIGNGTAPRGSLTSASSSYLFALGKTGPYRSFYCSSDGGRHWARACR